jgi:hypothetical protein
MGTGDPDTYKAFAWRFLQLARPGGSIGVVLPRSALAASGSAEWRTRVFDGLTVRDTTWLKNTGGWVFADVHQQYTVALFSASNQRPNEEAFVPIRGPFSSRERFDAGVRKPPVRIPLSSIRQAGDTLALPLLPSEDSASVWLQMRKSPRLDLNDGKSWRARPYRELDATNDKKLMKLSKDRPEGFWPVYKGESFDIWNCDTGSYYAWGDPDKLVRHLQTRRKDSHGRKDSPFTEFPAAWAGDPDTLPCLHPRIAFRDVSRATDSRTVRAALLPPKVFVANQAPYLVWPRGDEKDQACLLGVLCSIPLDWYARCHVETHVNYFVFNPLPVPRPGRDSAFWRRTVELAGRLAAQHKRLAAWGRKVGVECGPLADDEKNDTIAELDAVVAHLYGLSEQQVRHVFETFHEGWEYGPRLGRVLRHFAAWRGRA